MDAPMSEKKVTMGAMLAKFLKDMSEQSNETAAAHNRMAAVVMVLMDIAVEKGFCTAEALAARVDAKVKELSAAAPGEPGKEEADA